MKTVPVSQLKSRLSEYLRKVGQGARFVVTDRGKPIAELAAYGTLSTGADPVKILLHQIEFRGSVRGPLKPGPLSVTPKRPRFHGTPALDLILQDRRNS
ncbi:MAG TPA: type II toxin-antitoxin system Phd/YefM family antitoxin [Bdellovibrionota bacterium]|nr:type II toxin-antitoxin system Phd/YefM family antitoxin [Bdellovibrionota bacterium]